MVTLQFNAKKHTYTYGKQKLESVTTWCSRFYEPFDAKAIARRLASFPVNRANKRGVKYWLKQWKADAAHGTRTHELIEMALTGYRDDPDSYEQRDINKTVQATKFFEETFKEPVTAHFEKKIFDTELGLAGTIDCMVEREGKVWLIDWKTNKAFKPNTPVATHKLCQNGTYAKYALQIALYGLILERQGYKIHKLYIVHVSEDSYKEYEVDYPQQRIILSKLMEDSRWKDRQDN